MIYDDHPVDMPIMTCYAPCVACGHVFGFDPETVPSATVDPRTRCPIRPDGTPVKPGDPDGVREPLCPLCAHRFQAAGGEDRPVLELFPRARIELIDVGAASRIQAAPHYCDPCHNVRTCINPVPCLDRYNLANGTP